MLIDRWQNEFADDEEFAVGTDLDGHLALKTSFDV